MNETELIERTEIQEEINPILCAANSFMVHDALTFTGAMELGKACSARIKMVEERLGPVKRKSYEAYQEVLKLMKSFIDPLEVAKKLLSGRAYTWQKAEEERKRKEAEEERRKAEEEAAAKRKVEEDARLELADRMAKNGMAEQADEILAAPVVVAVAEFAVPTPKMTVQGASTRECWQGRVVDENLIPREYMTPDLVKLGKATKMLKGETRIPGWEVFDSGTVAFRG